jgi:phosphate transport system permease protein
MEKFKDKFATIILYIISGLILLLLVSFIGYIIFKGGKMLTPHFLFGEPKHTEAGGGIGPQLFNSFYLLVITLLLTVPLGVGAGIYLAEYAKQGKLLNMIRLCIDTMASLPSIVVGLFGLIVFVQLAGLGYSLIAGAFAITILNLASLTRVCENAIRSVPDGVKEASLALGATKWQTIKKVVLPAAMSQILTGVILASGRIFGEAAALIYTAGMSAPMLKFNNISLVDKASPFAITRSAETLAVYIWQVNSEGMLPDATDVANGAAAVLIIMVLVFNFSARIIGRKIYESYSGKK